MHEWKVSARIKVPLYRMAIACAGQKPKLQYKLGETLAILEEWPAAIAAYRAALAMDDDCAECHYGLGVANEQIGRWDDARLAYRAALAQDDDNAGWYWRYGTVCTRLSDWQTAVAAFKAAIARDGSNATWHIGLATAQARLEIWDAAASAYEAAIARYPNDASWHGRLGMAKGKLGDWSAAAAAYQAAIACQPENAKWHEHLGMSYARLGNWPGAAAAFEAAVKRQPNRSVLLARLGSARAKLRDWSGAVAAYETAIKHDETNVDFHRHLGNTLFKAQDWSRASDSYHKVFAAGAADDSTRYRFGFCLSKCGNEIEAARAVQPSVERANRLLDLYISDQSPQGCAETTLAAEVLFVPGAHTLLARKVSVRLPRDGERTYFEHTRTAGERCQRTIEFYDGLEQDKTKNLKPFVPRLHYHLLDGTVGFFLYEFIEPAASADYVSIQAKAIAEPEFSKNLVDVLIGLAKTDIAVASESPDERTPPSEVVKDISPYTNGQISLRAHDKDYISALEQLSKKWLDHCQMYQALPEVMAHRHMHDRNMAVSSSGRITIHDWENYGLAPVGFDFVTLFRDSWGHERFEPLANYYFDSVHAKVPANERTYVVSLLVAQESILLNRPIEKRWLDCLNSF